MVHEIIAVAPGSPADQAGLRPGMRLAGVNGRRVRDQIDYLALTAARRVLMDIEEDGGRAAVSVRRDDPSQPIGLTFGQSMRVKPLRCRNRCAFCFVDQLPEGMRPPLYVKDDDWRMSLMMGNYVTLTNLSDAGFARIISRKASPLYLSVHTLDPALRGRLLGLGRPDDIRPRLDALRDSGLAFHAQIVMCPGWNDGAELSRTLDGLAGYYPAARSVAVVPVGLTRYRDGLVPLRPVDRAAALETLGITRRVQSECLARLGTRFAFAADEMYIAAGESIPDDAEYEDYPQIENGVGLVRRFTVEFSEGAALPGSGEGSGVSGGNGKVIIVTGEAAAPFLRGLVGSVAANAEVRAISNRFWGETITVAGLVMSSDIIEQLSGVDAREIWIPDVMLSADGVFLDDRTPEQLAAALGKPTRVLPSDGAALRQALEQKAEVQ
ncbi:MAG: DUF512 domain-containing protein [Oscillospiraceae bacterium]|jgi:putative radical SAM enzyme (TIGR03279 family)|nr:DUF512 domain-containing protein [Oscillospiraceae bacterium]